ncbi:hypothetical protein BCR44DRAFT_1204134 [Catenaria anguillulae PL171]|uniref:Uncharacterized protein n=1 Tax=Catenaria anguillulae PL171 TaxID=765915 RepID=A0A1Y2H248_9FUNG|nr:hypothetical protein BCR44DRAFT_1204134 [Catenaria anguillulae PL171]
MSPQAGWNASCAGSSITSNLHVWCLSPVNETSASTTRNFGCLAHVLDLCSDDVFVAFPLLGRIFNLLKKAFRSNLVKTQYCLFLAQDARQVLMPPFMNKTRWDSSYIMPHMHPITRSRRAHTMSNGLNVPAPCTMLRIALAGPTTSPPSVDPPQPGARRDVVKLVLFDTYHVPTHVVRHTWCIAVRLWSSSLHLSGQQSKIGTTRTRSW